MDPLTKQYLFMALIGFFVGLIPGVAVGALLVYRQMARQQAKRAPVKPASFKDVLHG